MSTIYLVLNWICECLYLLLVSPIIRNGALAEGVCFFGTVLFLGGGLFCFDFVCLSLICPVSRISLLGLMCV